MPADTGILFTNIYKTDNVIRNFRPKKILEGRALTDGEFTFHLEAVGSAAWSSEWSQLIGEDEDGKITVAPELLEALSELEYSNADLVPMPENPEAKNSVTDGTITFGDIEYTAKDAGDAPATGVVYHYTIREVIPEQKDGTITYDEKVLHEYVHVYVEQTEIDSYVRARVFGDREATFTNTYTPPNTSLTLTKTVVSDLASDLERTWTFDITLTAPDGEVLPDLSGVSGLTVVSDGHYTAQLKHNESVTLPNLPIGTTYTVSERTTAGFQSAASGQLSGELTATPVTVAFTNTRDAMSVTKVWNDSDNADGRRPERVFIQLVRDGEDYGEPIELNAENNWTYTWSEPDADHQSVWEVRELAVPGYITTVTRDEDGRTFVVTNTLPDNPPPPPPGDDDDDDDRTDDNPPPPPTTPDEPTPEIPVVPELPDPNDPDSPDTVTILEDDVPTTYVKVHDPETDEFVYIPEDEVPLQGFEVPETGDSARTALWAVLSTASLIGVAVFMPRKREDAEE